MAKLALKRGTTSKIVRVFIQDSSKTDGSGLTGLLYNSAGLTAYYSDEGSVGATAVTLTTATVGTYTSGGFIAVDGTNLPGVYEVGIPNAALASGNSVLIMLKGATNMVPVLLEIELDAYDPQNATNLGLTNLDAAISSRAAIADYTSARAAKLDDLDATISSRLAASSYSAPPSTASIAAAVLAVPSNLLQTDSSGRVTVGTNADKSGYSLSTFVESGTAQAGAASTITLRSGASAVDSFFNNALVAITSGTGAGQTRMVTGYVGATKVATVDRAWATNPDATSTYVVLPSDKVQVVTNDDKTGYALTAGEHTAVQNDVTSGLTAQGYTTTRAGYLDTLNGLVAAIWANATRTVTSLAGNASDLAAGVWNAVATTYNTAGSLGNKLNSAASAGDPWNTALPGSYAAGTAGAIVGSNLDAKVSSRLATAGYTTPPTAAAIATQVWSETLPGAFSAGEAGDILGTNLDTTVSSRNATTPPTVTAIRQEMDANSTKLTNLDAAVSSRLATTGYTTPPTTSAVAAAILKTPANLLATNTNGQVDLDLTQAVPTSNTAQTVGDALNAARAQGFGKWVLSGTVLTIYAADGTTVVRTFTLDSATTPTQRT